MANISRKILCVYAAVGLVLLSALCGCETLDAAARGLKLASEQKESISSAAEENAKSPKAAPRASGSQSTSRGSDLKSIDAVGELENEQRQPAKSAKSVAFAWPEEMMPYRAMLSSAEQRVYDDIYSNVSQRVNEFYLPNPIAVDRIADVVHAVYYDNPDFFWLDSSYRYGYNNENRVLSLRIGFNDTAADFEASKARFDQAAEKIIAGAKKLGSDLEKEKYVHDALLDSVSYALDAPYNQSAYSALTGGRSVCAGYARAFQYILMKLGIPSYYCVGFAQEDHAWNIVRLDGAYYNVDVAWDDPEGNPVGTHRYEYFNLTDQQIGYDHERRDLSVNLPTCNTQKMGYQETFGKQQVGQPVRKGGAPLRYRDYGFTADDILTTTTEYYAATKASVLADGPGRHSKQYILSNEQLREEIYQAAKGREWFNQAVMPAMEVLGLAGYAAGIELSAEELAEGYFLLTQTITISLPNE